MSKKTRSGYSNCKKVWKMKEGLGKLNLVYISTFNGLNLLDQKPVEFENLRRKAFQVSLDNPKAFREFFNLKVQDFDQINGQKSMQSLFENLRSPKVMPSKLVRASSTDDPLITPMGGLKKLRTRHFDFSEKLKPSPDISPVDIAASPFKPIIEEKETPYTTRLQDFEYSGLGIFFKADLLVYEQVCIQITIIRLYRIKLLQWRMMKPMLQRKIQLKTSLLFQDANYLLHLI